MRFRFFAAIFFALFISVSASAQELSDDYRQLIGEAATHDDGTHFNATIILISNVAPGGADSVIRAISDIAPERLGSAQSALGIEPSTRAAPSPMAAMTQAPGESGPPANGVQTDLPTTDRSFLLGWSGRISAGLSHVSGNSEQQSYALGFHLDRDFGNGWNLTNRLDYGYAESAGAVSQDQLQIESRIERAFNDRWGAFLGGQYDRDQLSSYDWTVFASAGLTYQAIASDKFDWSLRAGPGVRYLTPTLDPDETQIVLDLGSDFAWTIDDTSSLGSETTLLAAESSKLQQVFSFTTAVTEAWALEFGWRYQYEFEPLPGFEASDSTVTISVVREF